MLLLFNLNQGSSGGGMVQVQIPDLVGLLYADAVTEVTDVGLLIYANGSEYSDTVPVGYIVTQTPQEGLVDIGTTVFVTLSLGQNLVAYSLPEDRTVLIPKINRKVVC